MVERRLYSHGNVRLVISACRGRLCGLEFAGDEYGNDMLHNGSSPLLDRVAEWLDGYFGGMAVGPVFPLELSGTSFSREVWEVVMSVPYGMVASYGSVAREMERRRGGGRVSPQAVGNALGKNPICIIMPCHRIINSDGRLGGFSAGLYNKKMLLSAEGHDIADIIPAGRFHRFQK